MAINANRIAAFIDLDGTLCEIFLWQGLFAHHQQTRLKRGTLYAFIAFHFPIWLLYKVKLISEDFFYRLHATNLAWLVKDVSIERGDLIWDWVIEHQLIPNLRPEMLEVIRNHKNQGHRIYLISGSYAPVVNKLAMHLALDGAIATPLEINDECYTGRIIPPLTVGQGKAERLHHYLEQSGGDIDLSNSYFYNDSLIDLPVMEMFGHPVAVHPDESLRAVAMQRGWQIIG